MIQEKDVQVPVRDGVKIGVRIYRPEGSGPFPALFAASPYHRSPTASSSTCTARTRSAPTRSITTRSTRRS